MTSTKRIYAADLIRGTKKNGSVAFMLLQSENGANALVRFHEAGPTYEVADLWVSEAMHAKCQPNVWSTAAFTASEMIVEDRDEDTEIPADIDPRLLRALIKAHNTRIAFQQETGVELDMVTWKLGGTLYLGHDPDVDLD